MSQRPLIPDLLVSLAESSVPGAVCTAEGCRVVPAAGSTAAGAADDAVRAPDPERRFGGLDRLYGDGAHAALSHLHVVVAGIGGVGTWCAEALARSGVGALTLVDLDHIVESNINRQIHALDSTLGRAKVLAMADRIRDIHPACRVRCVDDFVDVGNVADILRAPGSVPPSVAPLVTLDPGDGAVTAGDASKTDQEGGDAESSWANCVIDCTDQVAAKIALVLRARALGWPLLVCGGAGGKTDPLALRLGDLSAAVNDALLARVRQDLRKHHGYPKGGAAGGKPRRRVPRMGVSCLWFDQPVILPAAWTAEQGQVVPAADASAADASTAAASTAAAANDTPVAPAAPQGLSCAGYGSIVTVTATMGMAAANWAIRMTLQRRSKT